MPVTGFNVDSSTVLRVGHSSSDSTLYVQFKTKDQSTLSIYKYEGCSKQLFNDFVGAESIGKFFAKYIKSDASMHCTRLSVNSESDVFSVITDTFGSLSMANSKSSTIKPGFVIPAEYSAWCW